jgi:hypothetical protein
MNIDRYQQKQIKADLKEKMVLPGAVKLRIFRRISD